MDSGGGGGYGSGRRTSLTGGRPATSAGYHRSTSSFLLQHGEPTFGDLALQLGEAHGVRPQALDVASSEDPPRSGTPPTRRRSLSGRSHIEDGGPRGPRGRESRGVSDAQYGKAPSAQVGEDSTTAYAVSHGSMSARNEVVAVPDRGSGDVLSASDDGRSSRDHFLTAHEHASHAVATSMAADGSGRAHARHASSHNFLSGPYDGPEQTAQSAEREPAVTYSRHTSRRSSSSHSAHGSRATVDVHNGNGDNQEARLSTAPPPAPQSQPPPQPHAVPSPQLQQHQQQQFVRMPSYESEEADALMFNRFGSPALVTRLARASLDRQARRHSGLGEHYDGGGGDGGWVEGGGGVVNGGGGGRAYGHAGEAIVHAAPVVLQHPDVSRRRRSYTGEGKEDGGVDVLGAHASDDYEATDAGGSHAQGRVGASSGGSTDDEGFAARERRRRSLRHSRADDGRGRQGSLSSIAEHRSLDSDERLHAQAPVNAALQQQQPAPQRQPSGHLAMSPQQSAMDGQEARRRRSVDSYASHTSHTLRASVSSVGSGSRLEDGRRDEAAYVRQTEDAEHDVGGGVSYADDDDQRRGHSRGMAPKGSDHRYGYSNMAFPTAMSAVDGGGLPAPQPPEVHVLGSAHLAASSDAPLPPPPPPQPQQAQHEAEQRSRQIARERSRGLTQSSHGRRSSSVELIGANDASARYMEGSYAPPSDTSAERRRTVAAGAQGPHSYVQESEERQSSHQQQQVQPGHVGHQSVETSFGEHARHASWSTEHHDYNQQHVHAPVQRAPSLSTAEGHQVSQQPRAGEGHSRAMMRRASASAAVDLTARQGREVRRSVSEPAEDRGVRSGQGVSASAARRKTMGPGVQLQQPHAYQQQSSNQQQQQQQQHLSQAQWAQHSSYREHDSRQQSQHELHVQHRQPLDTVTPSPHSSHPPSPHARPSSSSSSSASAPSRRRPKQSNAHDSVSGAGELHPRRSSRQSSSGQETPAAAPVDAYDHRRASAPFGEGRRDVSSYERAAAADDARDAVPHRTGSAVAPAYGQRLSMTPETYDDTDDLAATETPAYEQPQQSWSAEGNAHHVQHVPAHRGRKSVDAGDHHSPPRSRRHSRQSSSISSPPAENRRYTRAGSQLRPERLMGDGDDDERDPHTNSSARRGSYESHRDGSAYLHHPEPQQDLQDSHERRSSVLRRPSVDTTERGDSKRRTAQNAHDRHGSADASRRLSWDLDGGGGRRNDVLHSNQSDHHGAHERGASGGGLYVDLDARYGHRGSQRGSIEFISEQLPHGGQPQQQPMDPEMLYLFRGLHREVDTLRQSMSELSDSTAEEMDALRMHADARYDEVKGQLGECLVYLRDVKQALEGLAKQAEGMREGSVRTEVGGQVDGEHRQQQQLHGPDKQQQQQHQHQHQQPPPAYPPPHSSRRETADPTYTPQPDAYAHPSASTPQTSPLRPPPPSLPSQHQQEQSPCRTPRAWHRMSEDRQRLLEEWIDHLEASRKSTKDVNRASLSENEHPWGHEISSAREDMRDTLKDVRERQQALEEVAAGMRVEMYRLEEKVGNDAQESRQRFDTVKKAFRIFADAVHVDLPSSMWRMGCGARMSAATQASVHCE